jgi:GNAT superfamily N-acetyltransferase
MEPRIIEEVDMTPDLDQRIRRGLVQCFPKDIDTFSKTRAWHGSGPSYTVMLEENGQIAAHLGVVDRVITVGETPLRVAGIQNVFVRPEYRGKGLSDRILASAMERAKTWKFDFGLLFCGEKVMPVYKRSGWILLAGREVVRVDESGSELTMTPENLAMYYPVLQRDFPVGKIHLGGNDW